MHKTALFPGSFDPFTAGHLNILRRALTMFDSVVIAIGINQDKRGFYSNEFVGMHFSFSDSMAFTAQVGYAAYSPTVTAGVSFRF